MHRLGSWLLVGALFAVAGCASRPAVQSAAVERPVAARFELEGRVSVRDGDRGTAASLYWRHRPDSDVIDFLAPTGQVMGRLESRPGRASMRLPDGEQRQAASLDELASRLLGFEVPVSRLRDWVQAAPGIDTRVLRRDALGRPALISERGWVVEYYSYADDSPGSPVRRLQARWGELQLTLLVDRWSGQ